MAGKEALEMFSYFFFLIFFNFFSLVLPGVEGAKGVRNYKAGLRLRGWEEQRNNSLTRFGTRRGLERRRELNASYSQLPHNWYARTSGGKRGSLGFVPNDGKR